MTTTTATTPERAQRADARRNRTAILDAARKRFAEDGLDAQMDEIARDAGLGVGTVYRHFPTKEELVDALALDRFERLAELAREALEGDDAWESFSEFMRRAAELQAADRALSEVMASRPEMMQGCSARAGLFPLMETMVARAQEAGAMRADAVPEDIPAIVCGLGRVTQAAGSGKTVLSFERFLGILLDGLRAPGATPLPDRD